MKASAIVVVLLTTLGVIVGARGTSGQFPGMPGPPTAAAPTGTAAVAGRVVDAQTGRPLAGALVAMTLAPASLASIQAGDAIPMDQLMSVDIGSLLSGARQVLTDAQGRFALTGLVKGAYSLAATKSGWSGGNYGQRRPDSVPIPFTLADAEQATNIRLDLWKNGTISGSVVDEAGEAIVGVNVRALRRTWAAGHARYAIAGSAQTDDRGAYRMTGLRSGEYVVAIPQTPVTTPVSGGGGTNVDLAALQSLMAGSAGTDPNAMIATIQSMASGRSGGGIRVGNWTLQTSSIVPPVLASNGHMLAYRTTFFPAAVMSTQATAVAVSAGEERAGIDFQLRPGPVLRIAGVVTGPSGGVAGTQVRLVPVAGEDAAPETVRLPFSRCRPVSTRFASPERRRHPHPARRHWRTPDSTPR
jgi:carboxypeptidase family protein